MVSKCFTTVFVLLFIYSFRVEYVYLVNPAQINSFFEDNLRLRACKRIGSCFGCAYIELGCSWEVWRALKKLDSTVRQSILNLNLCIFFIQAQKYFGDPLEARPVTMKGVELLDNRKRLPVSWSELFQGWYWWRN